MAHSGMSGSLADCSQDNVLSQRAGNTSAEVPLDGNSLRSSETFTPQQVARQLDLTSSKTPSPTPRSKVMRSALRGRSGRRTKRITATRSARLTAIPDTEVVKPKGWDAIEDSDSSNEESEETVDGSDEKSESDSDTGSEELRMAGGGEAAYLRMIKGDTSSEDEFFDEEPFEVALSTLSVTELMPELGKEEDQHCRTISAIIV